MFRLKLKQKIQVLIILVAVPLIAYASVTGPEPSYTGAPGDIGTCVNCHDTYVNANVGPGSIALSGLPTQYQAGQQYTLTVTVQQAARSKYGFQLTAIDGNGNRAGTLAALGSDTQVISPTGSGGRQYLEHTQQGTNPTTSNSRSWQVSWTAPSTDVGPVTLYFAGNAANGNGNNQGDYIYNSSRVVDSPTSVVSITLASPLDGQTLNAGALQRVNFNTTGQTNISFIEARYSTDDGATFPITNVVFSTSDASVTGFDWSVPNTPTTQGRLRIQVSTKSGTSTEVRSGRFTIQGGGSTAAKPIITSARISGPKLFINGSNFQEGAIVELNGADQKTVTWDPPTQALRCKKAGNKIEIGATVNLVVRNPDGTRSEGFLFTRVQ
ncbi:MAG: hypothetical protein HY231_12625 [Acidobacteria bacterium]|nr:hypothetical protein [Acidobacteriota bacterium]